MFSLSNKSAFTLAEVLIVLGIIGIIAEMTIPSLVENTQNQEFLSKMKKEYSVLQQAQMSLAADNGGSFANAFSNCNSGTYADEDCFRDVFATKLSYLKKCDNGSVFNSCFSSPIKLLNGTIIYDYGNPPGGGYYTSNGSSIVLKDGASLLMYLDSNTCTITAYGSVEECGWITIDVNGLQSPNTYGRDIYEFLVFGSTIKPTGSVNQGFEDVESSCSSSGDGQLCAAKYLIGGTINK